MNGGYKIIDFKKVALSSTRTAIEGIMEDLIENNGKAVLLTNVVINETEMDDCFSTIIVNSDQMIKLNCYDGYISINTSGVKYSSASVENLAEDIEYLNGKLGDLNDLDTENKDSAVDAINEVVENIGDLTKNNAGTAVSVKTYTASNQYVCPSDGYVVANSQTSSTGEINILVRGANNAPLASIFMKVTGSNQSQSLFVRKGMKVYMADTPAETIVADFRPLI